MSTDMPQPPGSSLGRLVNLSASIVNARANRLLAEHGLTLGQWVLLSALWQRDGLLVGTLAEYSRNKLPAVSRMIARMEEQGHVERRADGSDRRAVRVFLTPAGRDLNYLAEFHEQLNQILLDGLSPAETRQLFDGLHKVIANARTPDKAE